MARDITGTHFNDFNEAAEVVHVIHGEPRRRLSWRDIPPDEPVLHFRGGGGIDWLVVLGSA